MFNLRSNNNSVSILGRGISTSSTKLELLSVECTRLSVPPAVDGGLLFGVFVFTVPRRLTPVPARFALVPYTQVKIVIGVDNRRVGLRRSHVSTIQKPPCADCRPGPLPLSGPAL
jgi:hypothetical protein